MESLTFVLAAAHLLSAVFWVGGTLFIAVMGPRARGDGSPPALEFLRAAGLRFRIASWFAVAILLGTGVAMVARQGAFDNLGAFASARPALTVKVALVAVMVVVKAVHDFVVGPRAARLARQPSAKRGSATIWRMAMALGHANAALGVAVVTLAILVSEGA